LKDIRSEKYKYEEHGGGGREGGIGTKGKDEKIEEYHLGGIYGYGSFNSKGKKPIGTKHKKCQFLSYFE
jgi:hypothetical protein